MTVIEDALWIATIVISVYLTALLVPLVYSSIVLFVSGKLTWEWIHATGFQLIVVGTLVVFLPILYFLKRGAE